MSWRKNVNKVLKGHTVSKLNKHDMNSSVNVNDFEGQ